MLFRQEPSNPELYYIVNSEQSRVLHENNFFPKYYFNEMYYYEKTDELVDYMKGGEKFWQKK